MITGGSDNCGFPMRRGIDISGKKKILAKGGVGIKTKFNGMYIRKTVSGSIISDNTTQVNLKVLTEGKKKLEDMFVKKENESTG